MNKHELIINENDFMNKEQINYFSYLLGEFSKSIRIYYNDRNTKLEKLLDSKSEVSITIESEIEKLKKRFNNIDLFEKIEDKVLDNLAEELNIFIVWLEKSLNLDNEKTT